MTLRAWYLAAAMPLALACSHASRAAKAEAPAPAAVVAQPATPAPAPVAALERTCTADGECGAKELCLSSRCVEITGDMAACRGSAHFDFDRAELHAGDLPELRREARCLNALPDEKTLVEGNCDERGTTQYNIALGFRRAHAVAKYLEDLGVGSSQISEVSYGKELPLCTESTESCWSMNRRADVAPGAHAKDVTAQVQRDERRERSAAKERRVLAARHPAQAHRQGSQAGAAAAQGAQGK